MINWKVRIRNKNFWICMIPAILLLIKSVLELFGVVFDFEVLRGRLLGVVEAVFVILAILGIVSDPTTQGISDSNLAMTYEVPKKKGE